MRKEGHFLILHGLAEKEKVYKHLFNINRADGDKKELRRHHFLSENNDGISQPQHTFFVASEMFSPISRISIETLVKWRFFSLKKLSCGFHKLNENLFSNLTLKPDFGLCMAMLRKLNIISFTREKLPFIGNNGCWRICKE